MDTMINGLYGYFFGNPEEDCSDANANQENRGTQKPAVQAEEAEWILVDGMHPVLFVLYRFQLAGNATTVFRGSLRSQLTSVRAGRGVGRAGQRDLHRFEHLAGREEQAARAEETREGREEEGRSCCPPAAAVAGDEGTLCSALC